MSLRMEDKKRIRCLAFLFAVIIVGTAVSLLLRYKYWLENQPLL